MPDEPFPGKRKRFAVMLRMTEKRILLSSADAVFKEFPDEDEDLVKSTCEEIFTVEVDPNGPIHVSNVVECHRVILQNLCLARLQARTSHYD